VSTKQLSAMAFYDPKSVDDIARAMAWLETHTQGDALEGSRDEWSTLVLPAPRLHPRAAAIFAELSGVAATAITAVVDGAAYVADDGALCLWPWYPEETVADAAATAARLGLALPPQHLDEPFEPAYYLRRSGSAPLIAWLTARGIDVGRASIDRLPIPPRGTWKAQRFEGSLTAPPPASQALGATLRAVQMFAYVNDEARPYLEARLDRALGQLFARLAGDADPVVAREPSDPLELPHPEAERRPIGKIAEVRALKRGAVLVTSGALIAIDREGGFAGAWLRPMDIVFARGDLVFIGNHALDLAQGSFIAGPAAEVWARVGLADFPATEGISDRREPVLSACGRYALDVDESYTIIRMADGIVVAEGQVLERALAEPRPGANGLIDPDRLSVATPVMIDKVRFELRSGEPPVSDGRALAFALGKTWRFLVGNVVRDNARVIARLGTAVCAGAFTDDAAEVWILTSDHAIRIELDPTPRVAAIVPIEPLMRAARAALEGAR
jgi:hypothetical protein